MNKGHIRANGGSLIGKKVIWKGVEHTIIDKHNIGDYVLLDDDNMTMVGLHWNDVELVDELDKFILLQNIGKFKKGKIFDSFGGLVSGVFINLGNGEEKTIKFNDKEWFKLKK